MAASSSNVMSYEGCNFFRQRLILATLSGRCVTIKKARHKDEDLGFRDFEASFMRLMERITNGTKIEISHTGTDAYYQPGMLIGGTVEHMCNPQRAIGYYLEGLLCLAPFMKTPLNAVLRGVTNDQNDPSVDIIKASCLPVLKRFLGTDEGLELKITRRGAAPGGGGEVLFRCPVRQKLRPVQLTTPGKIKRIRGTAWACRVSPATSNRIVDGAKGVLVNCVPDVYIVTDHQKGSSSGRSPGFGLTLVAETNNGVFLCAECSSNPKGSDAGVSIPEDVGRQGAYRLLEEIYRGGCVDSTSQGLACVLMTLGEQDVSKVQTGPLSPYTIQFLRHIRDYFGVMFKLDVDKQQTCDGDDDQPLALGGEKVLLTCVGVGFRNLSKVTM